MPSPVDRTGVVTPVRVRRGDDGDPAAPSPMQARGPGWRRSSHGFYVPADVEADVPEQRIAEAGVIVPAGKAITGWAALRWRGGRWFDGVGPGGRRRPVTLLIGTHNVRAQPAHHLAVSAESVGPHMYDEVDGVVVCRPTWALSFEMRYARSVRAAARRLSLAAFDDLVSIEEMAEFLTHQSSWTGIPQARDACALAVENGWSPAEVDMALVWQLDAGRPAPLPNRPVFDRHGRHLFTPDLIDPAAGVVGEYNGETHRSRDAYHRDIQRWEVYRQHGLEAVLMSAADRPDTLGFERRLHTAYARAARRPADDRTWTVDPPSGWTSTVTVAQRRALSPDDRRRFLAYRPG